MKKTIIALIGLTILSLGVYSCSKEQISNNINRNKMSTSEQIMTFPKFNSEQIEQIGKLHNDLLVNYYNGLNKAELDISGTAFSSFDHPLIHNCINEASISERIEVLEIVSNSTEFGNVKLDMLFSKLSKIVDENNNVGNITLKIDELILEVKSDELYTINEYNAAMSMLSVGKYSAKLWAPIENGGDGFQQRIASLYSGTDDVLPVTWKEILKQDAWGAAGGLLWWCARAGYMSFVGGPQAGIGSLLLAAGGTAAGASWTAACPPLNYWAWLEWQKRQEEMRRRIKYN